MAPAPVSWAPAAIFRAPAAVLFTNFTRPRRGTLSFTCSTAVLKLEANVTCLLIFIYLLNVTSRSRPWYYWYI
jgi:hypothetical protein